METPAGIGDTDSADASAPIEVWSPPKDWMCPLLAIHDCAVDCMPNHKKPPTLAGGSADLARGRVVPLEPVDQITASGFGRLDLEAVLPGGTLPSGRVARFPRQTARWFDTVAAGTENLSFGEQRCAGPLSFPS